MPWPAVTVGEPGLGGHSPACGVQLSWARDPHEASPRCHDDAHGASESRSGPAVQTMPTSAPSGTSADAEASPSSLV